MDFGVGGGDPSDTDSDHDAHASDSQFSQSDDSDFADMMTELSVDVADIVVVDEELVEEGEDVEEDVEHAEVAEVRLAGEDADVDEEADTLRTTQHQVMMTLIKEVWMGHLILLLIDNLASISLLDLSQHVKVIFSNFFPSPCR